MTEIASDSTGPSPFLQGCEKEAWRLPQAIFDPIDYLDTLGKYTGASRYTRRAMHDS